MATHLWADETLDALREVGDPLADELVTTLGLAPLSRHVYELMSLMEVNGAPVPSQVPGRLRLFLDTTAVLPEWADPARIECGQRLFGRFGPLIVLSLTCGSLPECYAAAPGAQILHLAARMHRHTRRRVLETAQFVLDVMAPGGLGPEGKGVRSAQKVRLIHALNRAHLRRRTQYQRAWGVPVNQEDQLGTLMAFTVVVAEGLRRLGVEFSDEELESYLHTWLVIGSLLGVGDEHMPSGYDAARRLSGEIRRRHHAPCEAGRALTAALVDFMEQAVPGDVLDGFVSVLIRYLVGDDVAEILGIREEDWTRALLWPLRMAGAALDFLGDQSPSLGWVTEIFGRKFLEGTYLVEVGGQPAQFHVPAQLSAAWGLNPARPPGQVLVPAYVLR
jgi:hypothetical protein